MTDFIWPTYEQHKKNSVKISCFHDWWPKIHGMSKPRNNTLLTRFSKWYDQQYNQHLSHITIFPHFFAYEQMYDQHPCLFPLYLAYEHSYNHFLPPTNSHTHIFTIWTSIWPTQGDYFFEYGHGAIFEILDGSDHLFSYHFIYNYVRNKYKYTPNNLL